MHIINKIINLINSIANIIGMKLYQNIQSSRTISPCLISEIKVIRLKKNCINLLTNFILDFNRTGLFICSFERRPSRFLSPYRFITWWKSWWNTLLIIGWKSLAFIFFSHCRRAFVFRRKWINDLVIPTRYDS